jgi:hypothetical protein
MVACNLVYSTTVTVIHLLLFVSIIKSWIEYRLSRSRLGLGFDDDVVKSVIMHKCICNQNVVTSHTKHQNENTYFIFIPVIFLPPSTIVLITSSYLFFKKLHHHSHIDSMQQMRWNYFYLLQYFSASQSLTGTCEHSEL